MLIHYSVIRSGGRGWTRTAYFIFFIFYFLFREKEKPDNPIICLNDLIILITLFRKTEKRLLGRSFQIFFAYNILQCLD